MVIQETTLKWLVSVMNTYSLREQWRLFLYILSHNLKLQYSLLTQRGHNPDSPYKENQDSFYIGTQIQGSPSVHFFGIFDGHGPYGAEYSNYSNFVRDRLVKILANGLFLMNDPVKAYSSAFSRTNSELYNSKIDDSMSGTAAITVLVIGDEIYTANVGDSRT